MDGMGRVGGTCLMLGIGDEVLHDFVQQPVQPIGLVEHHVFGQRAAVRAPSLHAVCAHGPRASDKPDGGSLRPPQLAADALDTHVRHMRDTVDAMLNQC
jgi:hypothetical protein